MNDSMSIFLATTILALGGLGLYMYKSHQGSESNEYDNEEDYNEDGLFGSSNIFGWSTNDEANDKDNDDEESEEEYKPRKRNTKTQRNRRATGSSRRRY